MIEQITEHIEDDKEHLEDNKEPIQVVTPIKSKQARSDIQLQALANARQKAYKVRAENAEIKKQNKVKAKNESKIPQEVTIELQESHQEITDDSKKDAKDASGEVPKDASEEITDDLYKNENENIRDVKKAKPIVEESHIDRIERHASRQEYNNYINNLIDERVKYKPIKSEYKLVDGSYVIR